MTLKRNPLLTCLCLCLCLSPAAAPAAPDSPAASPALSAAEPVKVTERIDILELMKKGAVTYHLNEKAEITGKPEEVFTLKDGQLVISGHAYGCMVTRDSYQNYRLVTEFKWTGRTWGARKELARDSGVLVHCHGPAGAFAGSWPASVEAQIIEGGMGDFLILSPELPDGSIIRTTLESEFEPDRDGERRWKKGASRQTVTSGRINWEKRDEDWKDVVDYKGKDDPDAPVGEWNRMEVICQDGNIKILFNGRLVNEGFAAKPSSGQVAIQTEGAEMIVRRHELLPLGEDQ